MAHTYRTIQQWNNWLTQFLGTGVLEVEQTFLHRQLINFYGKHALLIGVPAQHKLFHCSAIAHQVILSPLMNKNKQVAYIESNFNELPVLSGSVDLVILPHTLEFIDNPRKLLMEACRVVKPEGDIIIFGFNTISLWGLKKWWVHSKHIPWSGHFISSNVIKKWLRLADFELTKQNMLMFRPPIHHQIFKKLAFLDWIGHKFNAFFGGIFVVTAKAKTIPLTPIKLHWKQPLSTLPVSLPGPTLRDT